MTDYASNPNVQTPLVAAGDRNPLEVPLLIDTQEAAALLGCSARHLRRLHDAGNSCRG